MPATDRWQRLKRAASHLIVSVGVVVSSLVASGPALAADWPLVQGTEPPDAPLVKPFGFVQFTTDVMLGGEVHGLRSPALSRYEGRTPSFNLLESGGDWGFSVRRARPGLRGAIPGTSGKVSYFLLAELGAAAIARDGPTLTDAAITLSYIPGARLRVGQFKLPMMDEVVEANPIAAEWVNFSLPAAALVNENPIRADGRYDGGASGFRDVGVEVFDTFRRPARWGHLAISYALVVSNGRRGLVDQDSSKDVTARTMASWIFSGGDSDPHRQELSLFAWGQRGERNLQPGGLSVQRIRSGVGVHLEKEPIRLRAELVHATGAIAAGQVPPFLDQPLVIDPYGRAIGGYVQARVRLFGHARAGVRYEELHRQIDDVRAERIFRTLAPMIEYDVVPRVRLQSSYEKRWLIAPGGTADAKAIAQAMGDRVAVQATLIF